MSALPVGLKRDRRRGYPSRRPQAQSAARLRAEVNVRPPSAPCAMAARLRAEAGTQTQPASSAIGGMPAWESGRTHPRRPHARSAARLRAEVNVRPPRRPHARWRRGRVRKWIRRPSRPQAQSAACRHGEAGARPPSAPCAIGGAVARGSERPPFQSASWAIGGAVALSVGHMYNLRRGRVRKRARQTVVGPLRFKVRR